MNRTRFASALATAALAAILLPSFLHAQITFQRTYGGANEDVAYSVHQTVDGGYIIAGYTDSYGAGSGDVYLVKTDAAGDTLWTRTFGGTHEDFGYSVQQTADSGFVVAGYTSSYRADSCDVYLTKTDAVGDTLWTRTYGGANMSGGRSVQQTTDGGCIIAGWTDSNGGDAFLIKTDAHGDTTWTRACGGPNHEAGNCVQQTKDGGYIIAGGTDSADSEDIYVVKTDSNGDTSWTRTYGGGEGEWVEQTPDGGYIVAGHTDSSTACLIKTDTNGDTSWTRTYSRGLVDFGMAVEHTLDGGYMVAGYTVSNELDFDVYLVKTDANGDTSWTKTYGGDHSDMGMAVEHTLDGGFIIAGMTRSYGTGGFDIYLIKTDSLGNVAASVAEPNTSPTRAPSLPPSCEPNPCRGATNISLMQQTASSKPRALRIYDSRGCLVHSVSGIRTSSFLLDLRRLPSGTYFIRCDSGGEHATARVVLQR